MDVVKVGGFIAKHRKELAITQKELARSINVSDKTISKWETGKGLPDPSMWQVLCKQLGVSINELLSGEQMPSQIQEDTVDAQIVVAALYERSTLKKHYSRMIWLVTTAAIIIGILLGPAVSKFAWAVVPDNVPGIAIMKYCTLHDMDYSERDFEIHEDIDFFDDQGGQRYFVHGVTGNLTGNTISFFYMKQGPMGLIVTAAATGP